jgi:phage terminase small subunit
MRGRKPIPTALKIVRGNPGKRPLNRNEPKVNLVQGKPLPPAWIKGSARSEWNIQIGYLIKNKVLAENELSKLARYCYLHGEFVKDARVGRPMNAAMIARIEALASDLGIGPSARTRIKVSPAEPENPFQSFLNHAKKA